MPKPRETAQWYLSLTVFHGPAFGHRIEITTMSRGRDALAHSGGTWKGLGVPESVLNALRGQVDALITEHLLTRYGIQGELPMTWSGEVGPF
jgi:hypothetical protein